MYRFQARTLLGTAAALAMLVPLCSMARGVSPYLPLNLAPAQERQIERVLILAGKPVIRRPIAAATVLDALPKACSVDQALCAEVRRYLERYMRTSGVTQFQAALALSTGDSDQTIPNAHGLSVNDTGQLIASAYYQPSDYLLLGAGGVVYDGQTEPTGTMLSVGFDIAQLDIGYKDHWFSPLQNSSGLISTQAPTMPSISLSNYQPITPLGIQYELFLAEMSTQDGIENQESVTSGKPRLAGLQLGIEPGAGYAISLNRLFQFGGGARGYGGLAGLRDAFFTNTNRPDGATSGAGDSEFGNQLASITSTAVFPGKIPFALRFEYAGEDNSYAGSYRLGNNLLTLGIDFPVLWQQYDFSYEISEWQPAWYVHHLYPQGLTNDGHVLGHWFGEYRRFGDAIGGRAQTLQVGWHRDSGSFWQIIYRTLTNQPFSAISYQSSRELGLRYANNWRGRNIGAELSAGEDVFGDSYLRLTASLDMVTQMRQSSAAIVNSDSGDSDSSVFIATGINSSHANRILADNIDNFRTDEKIAAHFAVGARRSVSQRGDLGMRIEFDKVDGHNLVSLRALDYRYRIGARVAISGFFGAGRYDVSLPAYGYYGGVGLQFMNLLPGWDLAADVRRHDKLARNKLLPDDPEPGHRNSIFFDLYGVSLYLSRHFSL